MARGTRKINPGLNGFDSKFLTPEEGPSFDRNFVNINMKIRITDGIRS